MGATGVDLAAFNCLLMRVKTGRYNPFTLEHDLREALARFERGEGEAGVATGYVADWFAPQAASDLLRFRSLDRRSTSAPTCFASCSPERRGRRGSRRTSTSTFPPGRSATRTGATSTSASAVPSSGRRISCAATRLDTLARLKEFCARARHAARRSSSTATRARPTPGSGFDAVITSPPYPGLIDYHEQHRYAYELLGLDDLRESELGAAAAGTSREALARYVEGIGAVLARSADALRPGAPLLVVVNDRRELYPAVLERAGLRLDGRYRRHVNRRTGLRAGEYFEDVLVATPRVNRHTIV